jgi:hypothetical protein
MTVNIPVIPYWNCTLNGKRIQTVNCTGPGNVAPLIRIFGEKANYTPNDAGTEVSILYPFNPTRPSSQPLSRGDTMTIRLGR